MDDKPARTPINGTIPTLLKEAAQQFYRRRGKDLSGVIERLLEEDLRGHGIDPYDEKKAVPAASMRLSLAGL